MADLALTNVVSISVSQSGTGIGQYNTSNLALFSREAFGTGFGALGYKIYLSPTQVGVDFGTSSSTFAMANAVFSQQPNILANVGYLVVIPFLATAQTAVQSITTLSPALLPPASGAVTLNYAGGNSGALAYNASNAAIQSAIRLIATLGTVVVVGTFATGLSITLSGIVGAAPLFTFSANTLADAATAAITPVAATTTIGSLAETLDSAINRTQGLVQYFGIMSAEVQIQTVMLAAAAVIQPLNKIGFFASYTAADVSPGGMLDLLRSGSFSQSRGLFYGDVLATSLVMMASYVGRAISTNFQGSKTTQSMHLKNLIGVQPDPSMTQTLLNQCLAAGADVYCSIQGVPKVFCSGANTFFDNVYNLQWFIGSLQVAGFNQLAQTSTKIAQTEDGLTTLKSAYANVCEQALTNQFAAPGAWNNPTTFGVQADLFANISQRGYYIYSSPVSQQAASVRATRAAPLIQIALKYAGAIHSGSVIVNVNA